MSAVDVERRVLSLAIVRGDRELLSSLSLAWFTDPSVRTVLFALRQESEAPSWLLVARLNRESIGDAHLLDDLAAAVDGHTGDDAMALAAWLEARWRRLEVFRGGRAA